MTRSDARSDNPPDEEKEIIDGPFAVKFMLAHHKRLLAAARKRTHQTAGEWLGEAIEEKVQREREPNALTVLPPERPGRSDIAVLDPLPPLSIDEVGRAVEIAQAIAKLRGRPLPPNAKVLIGAQRVLTRRLGRA
jgi:hypothetical protein